MSQTSRKNAQRPSRSVHGDDGNDDIPEIKYTPPNTTLEGVNRGITLTKLSIAFVLLICVFSFTLPDTASHAGSLTLQGLCSIPVVTMVYFCTRLPDITQEPRYSELVDLQVRIEPIVRTVGYGSSLAGDMLKSGMAVEDLMPFVERSQLESKYELIPKLNGFVASANAASHHLSDLDAAVTHTVDSIISMDNYAVEALERIRIQHGPGAIITRRFFPFNEQGIASRNKLVRVFNRAMDLYQDDIAHLIGISSVTMEALNGLRYHLTGIHKLVTTEKADIKARQDKVLADLWSYLGGNRQKRQAIAQNMGVLEKVDDCRSRAAIQVGDNLARLRSLQANLQQLRRKVNSLNSADEGDTSLEMHIAVLRKGVARLNEEKSKAEERHGAVMRRKMGRGYVELP